jgi:hypothetical protein
MKLSPKVDVSNSVIRGLYDKALGIIKYNKLKDFTDKKNTIFITYDQWSDLLTIFRINWDHDKRSIKHSDAVFRTNLGEIEIYKEGIGNWEIILEEEYNKRFKNVSGT